MNTIERTIRNTIRKHRIKKGYSQEYIAHNMNISQSLFAKIENGSSKLTLEKLIEISSILELDIKIILKKKKISYERELEKELEKMKLQNVELSNTKENLELEVNNLRNFIKKKHP